MDLTPLHLGLLAVVAVVAGAINALAGGGTLLTFPALIAAGLPPVSANVTNTVALVPGYAGGTAAQRKELGRQRHDAVRLALAGAVGGLIGGLVLLRIGDDAFERVVPFLILFSAALLAVEPRLRDWVVWEAAAVMAIGSFVGGSAGGRLADRVPQRPLRILMVVLGAGIGIVYLVRLR